jgi:TolB-like protein
VPLLVLVLPRTILAQCPDGTPPPCAVARRATVAPPPPAERRRSFMVLPFRNLTRASEAEWIVEGSTTLLGEALSRWRELAVVDEQRLYSALRRFNVAPGTVAEPAAIRRIAEETGGWTVITGEVLVTGATIRITARAIDAVTGQPVGGRAEVTVRDVAQIREGFAQLGDRLAGSASGIQVPPGPVARTRSLEAYRAYLAGMAHDNRLRVREARAHFTEAVRLDSTFAEAWLKLAETSSRDLAELVNPLGPLYRNIERAAALASSLSPRGQLVVRGIRAFTRARFAEAREAFRGAIALDSADVEALEWLATVELLDWVIEPDTDGPRTRGNVNETVRLAERAVALDPVRGRSYEVLAYAYGLAAGIWTGADICAQRGDAASLAAFLMAPCAEVYRLVWRDSFRLIVAPREDEKVTISGPDSAAIYQRLAVEPFRQWTARWQLAVPNLAEAHLLTGRAHEFAGHLDSAVTALTRAESLGVQTALENPAARRLVVLGRLGRLHDARRVADSLQDAGVLRGALMRSPFLADPAAWSVAAWLAAGDTSRLSLILGEFAPPEVNPFATLSPCGHVQARIYRRTLPDSLRSRVLSTFLESRASAPADWRITSCAAQVMRQTVSRAGPGMRDSLAAVALAFASRLAAAGDTSQAHHFVDQLGFADSSLRVAILAQEWVRGLRAARDSAWARTEARLRPLAARLSGEELVFEWRVAGPGPFEWDRRSSAWGEREYQWDVRVEAGGAMWAFRIYHFQNPGAARTATGQLADLLRGKQVTGIVVRGREVTSLSGIRGEITVSGDTLRVAVRHGTSRAAILETRPASAAFRFYPCVARRGEGGCLPTEVPLQLPR